MTPTHTMRVPVRAWQVGEDGSLPVEARKAIMAFDSDLIVPEEAWIWYSETDRGTAEIVPGDWIVLGAGQLAIVTDAEFRARCEEVAG